ncbi:MAG TPA: glycosyltransferase, partial [Pedococcus sp.]|nr:glycosyltransferase [Pedococcus sp.]
DLLLLPSVEEGSALVTYEAQASGCVPVVSDAAGARCTHDVDGLVHPARDLPMLTEQLVRLSTSADLLTRLRTRALAHSPTLTWDAAADRLVAAYGQALSAGAGAHLA